tara:strand:- start:2 stop:850 length:849 start_codon:yes stop_codon:yes gene_type:complete
MIDKIKNKSIINYIINNRKAHIPNSNSYKKLKTYFKNYFRNHLKKKESKFYLAHIGKFTLPYFKMGKINSSHLLGLDEIIIFTFYILNKKKISRVVDLGANIGMHSIILGKLGYKVKSFEPDPDHIKEFLKNKKINKLKNVKLIKKAVDIKRGNVIFTKIINNTTGSFIKNAKKETFGPIKKFKVKTESFKNILKWAQLIKMDVEGLEADLINTIKFKDLINKKIILEVGSKKNAKKIFSHAKKNKFSLFSQKIGWNLVKKPVDMPFSYKEGSLIISSKNII